MSQEFKIWLAYFVWLQGTWIFQVAYSSNNFYASLVPILLSLIIYLLHAVLIRKGHTLSPMYLNRYDVANAFVLIVLGGLLDSIWVHLKWIQFKGETLSPFLAPFWIVVLWMQVGLLLRISFNWMLKNKLLGIFLAFISAYLCYAAAEDLNALTWETNFITVFIIGLSWIIAIPGLLFLSTKLRLRYQAGH